MVVVEPEPEPETEAEAETEIGSRRMPAVVLPAVLPEVPALRSIEMMAEVELAGALVPVVAAETGPGRRPLFRRLEVINGGW